MRFSFTKQINTRWFTPTPVLVWFRKVKQILGVCPLAKKGFIARVAKKTSFVFPTKQVYDLRTGLGRNQAKPFLVRGFTLFELLVSISIMLLMTMVVIFNYNDFRDNVGLTTAIQDVSLDVREMQSDALGVKEYVDPENQDNNTFDVGYGLRFYRDKVDETYTVRATDYTLFRDFLTQGTQKKYNEGVGSSELISSQTIPTGYYIKDICFKPTLSSLQCFVDTDVPLLGGYGALQYIDVVFTRPSSEASLHMYQTITDAGGECKVSDVLCTFDFISVEIKSDKTASCSAVRIYSSGQLSTGEACISGE